jgi:ABC-type Mn2+/Zn2+ transport system ATPase subunit
MRDRDVLALVEARRLRAGYGTSVVLNDVDFELRRGERMAVLGPNGGGKSTLFRVLLGELEPFGGELTRDAATAFVPQTERSRLDYPVSALDVALMGTLSRLSWWKPNGRRERRFAREALRRVGLAELAGEQFGELSGGQRQRVLVARALVQDAPVLLLDEPFVGVDRPSEELLEQLLVDLADEGRGIMVATHDIEQTYRYDRVLCLNRRQVAVGPPLQTLTREVLEATYGGAIVTLPGEGRIAAIVPPHHH